jgi:phosphoglycolate phosphatase
LNINQQKNSDLQRSNWPQPTSRSNWYEKWSGFTNKAVLFDLDGTLLDTAGDLGAAANSLRAESNLPPMSIEILKPHTSRGARGMIEVALGVNWDDSRYEDLRLKFLKKYEKCLLETTNFMPGMKHLLKVLEKNKILWGIVTNKHKKYTLPIVKGLDLFDRCATLICGDTLEFCKPHPAPVEFAINNLQLNPQAVVYVGDDARDIQSGFNAGCWTIGIAFETFVKKSLTHDWGCDETVFCSEEIQSLLNIKS